MLRTLFGELAPRRMPSSRVDAQDTRPVELDEHGMTVTTAEAAQALHEATFDVVVDASPAAAMRAHFAHSRADLDQASAMITLLDPSRLWASQVVEALSEAASQSVERLALRERGTLRTLAVIERTTVPRRGAAPLKVYHADIRATGLEQEEIANALAEGSHLTAVIIGAMQPHAVVALLRSMLAATRQPEWRCPWLVFILPPGAAALRQRILDQDWPPHVRTAAMTESLSGASSVWNAVLTAWEAASHSPTTPAHPRRPDDEAAAAGDQPAALQPQAVARALGMVARTEGLLACGLVNLGCGDLLAADARDPVAPDLAALAAAACAARQAYLGAAGPTAAAPDELLTTAGAHQLLLRTTQVPTVGLVALIDRSQTNLALLRFRLMEAEKHLL